MSARPICVALPDIDTQKFYKIVLSLLFLYYNNIEWDCIIAFPEQVLILYTAYIQDSLVV